MKRFIRVSALYFFGMGIAFTAAAFVNDDLLLKIVGPFIAGLAAGFYVEP